MYLPVDSETVDEDGVAFLGSGLAEALEQDEDAGGLRVVQSGIVAAHDVVQENVYVGHFVRVKRSYERV